MTHLEFSLKMNWFSVGFFHFEKKIVCIFKTNGHFLIKHVKINVINPIGFDFVISHTSCIHLVLKGIHRFFESE